MSKCVMGLGFYCGPGGITQEGNVRFQIRLQNRNLHNDFGGSDSWEVSAAFRCGDIEIHNYH